MTNKLIAITAVAAVFSVSCKEKPPEVKQAEEVTAKAVESGAITQKQADAITKQVENSVEIQDEAKKVVDEQLSKLEAANTLEEMRAAVKDATEASVDLAVKSGILAKDQAELSLQSLDSIDLIPEDQLKTMVEQLKTQLRAAQSQAR